MNQMILYSKVDVGEDVLEGECKEQDTEEELVVEDYGLQVRIGSQVKQNFVLGDYKLIFVLGHYQMQRSVGEMIGAVMISCDVKGS